MSFLPHISPRQFRLLVAGATAIAATSVTVSTAAAAPAPPAASVAVRATAATTAHAAAPASRHRAGRTPHAVSLASTISLDTCSASLARYPSSKPTDRALMLTNGHCWEGGFILPNQVLLNLPSSRTGKLLNARGQAVATVRTDRLLYATMTGTDISVYRLTRTFAQIKHSTGLTALTIASSPPAAGDAVSIPAGYWKIIYPCAISGFVPSLHEAIWTWHDSIRYQNPPSSDCQLIGGTSGSPIVDDHSRKIVGINNTANEDGQSCTLNNPCEVDSDGNVTAIKGEGYGQQTYWITTCLTRHNSLDLNKAGCLLPKP
ncbi:MAG: hypothetical protein QOE23_2467 [Pseudonocardiales bacterium]|jgi:hypothetical protein|nr:hypothetical protein [Pseudonocardiales bacterium]